MTRRRRDRVRRARNRLVRVLSRERGNYYYDGAASVRSFLADGYGAADLLEMARVRRRLRQPHHQHADEAADKAAHQADRD